MPISKVSQGLTDSELTINNCYVELTDNSPPKVLIKKEQKRCWNPLHILTKE